MYRKSRDHYTADELSYKSYITYARISYPHGFFKKGEKNSILPDTVYAYHKHWRKQSEENRKETCLQKIIIDRHVCLDELWISQVYFIFYDAEHLLAMNALVSISTKVLIYFSNLYQ